LNRNEKLNQQERSEERDKTMKKSLWGYGFFMMSLLGFVTAGSGAGDNLLINPDFEMGMKGWSEWNSVPGAADGKISTEKFHGGVQSAKRWLTKPTELTYSSIVQDYLPAAKGDEITLSGWLMSPSEDPLVGGAEAFLVIEFWRGTEKMAFHESERLHDQGSWKEFKVSGIVPEGTELIKICCFLFGFKGSSGTVYFDDLKVELKSEKDQNK